MFGFFFGIVLLGAAGYILLSIVDVISAGWMGVFEALDLPWPTRPSGEPDFWTAARSNLRSLGIASGRDFE